jgi:hypothetical protein
MATMATDQTNSSRKPESPQLHEATPHETKARPHEVGKNTDDASSRKPSSPPPESLDSDEEDPYDNVACTD